MKLQHAAGFALVGWYLMLPPPAPSGKRLVNDPLLNWELIDTFESESACENMLAELIKRIPRTAIVTARCVPSNDPYHLPENEPGVVDDLGGG